MRVLHLSSYDLFGGAGRAAFRLHCALRQQGTDSLMLVRQRRSDRADVLLARGPVMAAWRRGQRRCDRLALLGRGPAAGNFSVGWVPDGLAGRIAALRPDVLHLHWVGDGFFHLETLREVRVPVLWTMHDLWPFTGGCHYPAACRKFERDCGACPVLRSARERDFSRRGWLRRQRVLAHCPVTFVAPSRWLAREAQASALLRDRPVEVIANGLDTNVFSPTDRPAARRHWGLPQDKVIILAGAVSMEDSPRKGFADFRRAIAKVAEAGGAAAIEVVLFGSPAPAKSTHAGVTVTSVGTVRGQAELARLYAAADFFVAPSLEDNLPNTLVEALAAGTPAVAYDSGGIPEIVDHEGNGLLVPTRGVDGLAAAMQRMIADPALRARFGQSAREKAVRCFSESGAAASYQALYRRMLQPAPAATPGVQPIIPGS